MDFVIGNAFFLLLLLVCVGMHMFGHGHDGQGGHDHSGTPERHDQSGDEKPRLHH